MCCSKRLSDGNHKANPGRIDVAAPVRSYETNLQTLGFLTVTTKSNAVY